jgi:hypothetical protein
MTKPIPFPQRFGTGLPATPLDKDVPESARVGLLSLLGKLVRNDYIATWFVISTEALHVARRLRQEFPSDLSDDEDICVTVVKEMPWDKFYIFCEKTYTVLQSSNEEDRSLAEARQFYTDEINELMAEENLAYEFADGLFHRRGRPQTQKSLQRVSAVLSDPSYVQVRNYYNKAIDFLMSAQNRMFKIVSRKRFAHLKHLSKSCLGKRLLKILMMLFDQGKEIARDRFPLQLVKA